MKLIKQSYKIIEQQDFSFRGIKQFIERCARVCYKSEDKATDTSHEKFVDNLIKKDHARALEFGTVHLKFTDLDDFDQLINYIQGRNKYNQLWFDSVYDPDTNIIYATTNYRYYLQLIKEGSSIEDYFTEEDNDHYTKRYTVHFILSRGIMDEFRTHIGLSHLGESTRYCNYSKDRFDNKITFIKPSWVNVKEGNYTWTEYFNDRYVDTSSSLEDQFIASLLCSEKSYLDLLRQNCKPQEARDILPLSVKSELISCGFKEQWDNFFYRRCAKDAHPMAREIAIPLKEDFDKLPY